MLVVITSAIIFTSCSGADPDKLSVTSDHLEFQADDGKGQTVNVETNVKSWEVSTSSPEWIKISRSGVDFTVKVEKYTDTTKDRSGDITVTAGNAKQVSVTVTQRKASKDLLSVDKSSLPFLVNETVAKTVAVTTTANSWDATTDATWFTLAKQVNTFSVSANALNRGASQRSAGITVTAGNADPVTVTVTQDVTKNTLSVAPDNISFNANETDAKTATITTDADDWNRSFTADWLTAVKEGNLLKVTPTSLNTGTSERSAEITLTAGNADPVILTVKQANIPPVYVTVDPTTITFSAGVTSAISATVSTNAASWSHTGSAHWLEITPQVNSIRFAPSGLNTGNTARSVDITVTAPGASSVIVKIIQEPTPYLSVDPRTIIFTGTETGTKSATISTNVASWSYTGSASWLTIEKQNNELRFTPTGPNTGTVARTATITVSATGATPVPVTVTQEPDSYLKVDPTTITFLLGETGMKAATVTTTAASWSYTGSANWLTITPQGNQLRFTPTGLNTGTAARTVTINVTAPGLTSVLVTIRQEVTPITLKVDPTSHTFAACETGTKTSTVTTTAASWSYTGSANWLTVAVQNNTIRFTPTSLNTGTAARTATITVTASGATSVPVTIRQEPGMPICGDWNYSATGTRLQNNPPYNNTAWNGTIYTSLIYDFIRIDKWAGATGIPMWLDWVGGRFKLDIKTKVLNDVDGIHEGYYCMGTVSSSGVVTAYPGVDYYINYNPTTRVLDFSGTYNGLPTCIIILPKNKNTGQWLHGSYYINEYRDVKITLTTVMTSSSLKSSNNSNDFVVTKNLSDSELIKAERKEFDNIQ